MIQIYCNQRTCAEMFFFFHHVIIIPAAKAIYNIANRAMQSNSVHVGMLQILIVHSDCASKSLCQKFLFPTSGHC